MSGIVVFTDIRTDVDDVGAIAIAAAQSGRPVYGLISTTNAMDSGRALAVLDNHYDLDARIGIDRNAPSPPPRNPYTRQLASEFPIGGQGRITGARRAFIQALRDARRDGNGVEVVSLGSLGTMGRLTRNRRARRLARDVVTGTTIMGGNFDSGSSEFNVRMDPGAANQVANRWPGEKRWVGFEQGVDILTGARLRDRPGPARRAYELYPSAGGTGRVGDTRSWDKVAIASVYRPRHFRRSAPIDLSFGSNGETRFSRAGSSRNRFLLNTRPRRTRRFINRRLRS